MSTAIDERGIFLSTAPIGRRDWRLAGTVVVISILVFAVAAPFAKVPWPKVPAFIPVYESAVVVNDFVTAVMLYGQFTILHSRALLVLASGYLFTALMATVHALTFPGLFSETGLLGAGLQSTAWLYMFWHAGFPLLICAYAMLKHRDDGLGRPLDRPRAAILGSLIAVLLAVGGLAALATAGGDALPPIMDGNHYTSQMRSIIAIVWALPLIGLATLAIRRPLVELDLWLMVVMCVWLFDIALSAVFNAGRFDVGFYLGRIYGLVAASFVLSVMLLEINRLYGSLAIAASELEQRVRERTMELGRSNEALRNEVAEKKQAQEQLFRAQKLQAVGQLTGGIAHDFNNLLGVIVGNLDVASERIGGDARLKGPIQAAIEGAEHGAELTKRLLAFSRKQMLQLKRIDLNDSLPDVARMLERTLGKQIAVRLRPGQELWPCITDPVLVEDAILNLAINARDAMPNGGTLTIDTSNARLDEFYASQEVEVTAGEYVLLAVSDTGSGMAPDVLDHVFEPFFTTKAENQGTGLGLSMVYGFVKQSKGHIKIYSEVGHGTTVRIYLPRAKAATDGTAAKVLEPVSVPRGSETILVVDDNRGMRAVTVNQLSDLGYVAVEAENAAEALDALKRDPAIAMLFSDVIMPGGMNGYELAQEARRRRPDLKILLTSGYTSQSMFNLPGDTEKPEMINKPFRMRELGIKLRQILESA
jgi:signal transduction histidine kinase/CheY-like chemotaxis protein